MFRLRVVSGVWCNACESFFRVRSGVFRLSGGGRCSACEWLVGCGATVFRLREFFFALGKACFVYLVV